MVFSAANSGSSSEKVYDYGYYFLKINPQPLVQATKAKEHLVFDIQIKLINCKKDILQRFLASIRNEILNKVDIILQPLTDQVDTSSNEQVGSQYIPTSTIGRGTTNISVQPKPIFANTSDPNEIVFRVEINISAYNRSMLERFLTDLSSDVLDRVNDAL